ncbi:hypothetical protein, partial [uncultured Allobaculum sp.]|uniref:hypothetical protein n=1 Tax=uncultured Allobaculum sp. TaxID=1187017 RepID=UPI002592C286
APCSKPADRSDVKLAEDKAFLLALRKFMNAAEFSRKQKKTDVGLCVLIKCSSVSFSPLFGKSRE